MQLTHRQIGKQRSNIIEEKRMENQQQQEGNSLAINVRQPQIKRLANCSRTKSENGTKKDTPKEAD